MPIHNNWRTLSFLFLLGVADLTVAGCRGRSGGAEAGVVAQVNGYKVSRAEFDRAYHTQTARAPQKLPPTEEAGVRLQVLDQIIQTRLILQKAEQLGIKVGDNDVEQKLTDEKKPYTKEAFEKRLSDAGLTEDDYKTYLNHAITVDKLLAKEITPRLNVPDADVNAFYDQNKDRLPQPVNEALVKQQIRDKLHTELEQVLKTAYVEQLRYHAEIQNYFVEEVLNNHQPAAK
jgi:parvulin-like peptidyl-prolyl isomerase